MSRFNTGNPLGSDDLRDLSDNAKNVDIFSNDRDTPSYTDRFGATRMTIHGMEQGIKEAVIGAGYIYHGDYSKGLVITGYNQIVRDDKGEFWRVSGTRQLPYILTGDGVDEDGALVGVGDAVLRRDLSESDGASLIGYGEGNVLGELDKLTSEYGAFTLRGNTVAMGSVSDLLNLNEDQRIDTLIYAVSSYRHGSGYGGGLFYWDNTSDEEPNDGTIFSTPHSSTGRFKRIYSGPLLAEFFGAEPWHVGGNQDSTEAFRKCARAAKEGGVWRFSGRHRVTGTVWIPSRQTFGGYSKLLAPWRHLMSDPKNFTEVNTGNDLIGDGVFFDLDEGECFILGEGAVVQNFTVYGKGVKHSGVDFEGELDPDVFYDTTAFRFGKFIKVSYVDVSLFKFAFWSRETKHKEGPEGVPVSGNYYSNLDNVTSTFCYTFFTQSDSPSYNMTWNNVRTSLVQRVFNTNTRASNFLILSGAFEAFGSGYAFAVGDYGSDITLIGSYFEKYNGRCHTLIVGDGNSSITVEDCTIFLNYIVHVINRVEAGNGIVVFEKNKLRIGDNYGAVKPTVFRLSSNIDTRGSSKNNIIIGNSGNVIVYSDSKRFVEYDIG